MRVPLIVVAFGATLLPAGPASADVIYALGGTSLVDAPDPMDAVVDRTQAFSEQDIDPGASVIVNETSSRRIASEPTPSCDQTVTGISPTSDFVFQNPGEIRRNMDVLIFPGPVLGVALDRSCGASSDVWGRSGVAYPAAGGLELLDEREDAFEILGSRRAVFHRMTSSGPGDWDGYRVISEMPAPALITDVQLDCQATYEDMIVAEGQDHRVTMTLSDAGPLDAPDAQIAFRHHVTMTVTNIEGPFTCTQVEDLRVYVCTLDDATLRRDAMPVLTVDISFEEAPAMVTRITAFGSGAVNDSEYGNNDCDLVAIGADRGDGGVGVDGGGVDGGVVGGGGEMPSSFRGGGGCECDASPGAPASAVAPVLLVLLALRRNHRPTRRARSGSPR